MKVQRAFFLSSQMILIALLLSCNPKANPSREIDPPMEIIEAGGDRDDHGCIASAGYTWSQVKENCIRLWEEGISLQNAKDKEASTVCYIVSGNDDKIEAFLPESPGGIILSKDGGNWSNPKGGYTLKKGEGGMYSLYKNKELIYQNQGE